MQQFVTHLQWTAKDCAFGDDLANQLRDAIVSKCLSLGVAYVKMKLLEDGPTLVEEQLPAMRVNNTDIKGTEAMNQISKRRGCGANSEKAREKRKAKHASGVDMGTTS